MRLNLSRVFMHEISCCVKRFVLIIGSDAREKPGRTDWHHSGHPKETITNKEEGRSKFRAEAGGSGGV